LRPRLSRRGGRGHTTARIHGACALQYLGKTVSAGCIRLMDQDVIDLHDRVRDGLKVVVLASIKPKGLGAIY
jgi:lipoprotein-anchoring transpeptidase ErfK/SrfK